MLFHGFDEYVTLIFWMVVYIYSFGMNYAFI